MIINKEKTQLKQIYEILQKDDKKKEKQLFIKPTRPDDNKAFYFNPFNIPNVRSVKSTKERLSKVLAFIDMKKQVRFSDGFTVMNISVYNKRLLSICGSHQNVSRFISYMIKIGLLAEYDEDYQFNAFYNKDNKCKSYVYCKETEDLVKEYCITNNINKYQIKNKYTIENKFGEEVKSFEPSEVRFNSKTQFLKPDNWSTTDFEEYLTMCLYENYPQLQHYQDLADTINETYYNDDFDRQIQFRPNFTWSKGNKSVRKIGIRSTNSLVSCKKSREEDDQENLLYRDDVLKRYGLSYEFDVKSSVPRVTYLLNRGVWLDNNVDLYQTMYDHFIKICPSEKMEWNAESREIFKTFHMRGYFDTYSKVAAHIKHAISKKIDYKKDDWSNLDYVMKSYKKSIEETIGTLKYDSEIFFHESCIYMDVLLNLLERNFNVLQIYDGFYLDKECKDIEEVVKQSSESYFNNYIKDCNTNTSKNTRVSDVRLSQMLDCSNIQRDNTIENKFGATKNKQDYIKSLATEALYFDQLE